MFFAESDFIQEHDAFLVDRTCVCGRLAVFAGKVNPFADTTSRLRQDPKTFFANRSYHCDVRSMPQQSSVTDLIMLLESVSLYIALIIIYFSLQSIQKQIQVPQKSLYFFLWLGNQLTKLNEIWHASAF